MSEMLNTDACARRNEPRASVNFALSVVLFLVGLAVFCTTVYGIVRSFSPLPYSDQWIGGLGLLRSIEDGNYRVWWSQHMEHRIVLSRILFWLDAEWFGGRNVFLLLMAVVIQFGTLIVFYRQFRKGRALSSRLAVLGISLALLFSWVQNENFVWAFQSQFVAIYLFAIAAYSAFTIGMEDGRHRLKGIGLALGCALLATLSMGNGLMVFALLSFQCVVARRPWKELAVVVVVGGIVGALYLHGFVRPDVSTLSLTASEIAKAVPYFFLSFLGAPVYFLTLSTVAAALSGFVVLAVMTVVSISLFRKREVTPYRAFLITGYAFIVVTGLAAASSRYGLGLGQAVVSRYGTPIFISWVCAVLLLLDVSKSGARKNLVAGLSLALAVWVGQYQFNVTRVLPELHERDLAVLAMKVGADRPERIKDIFFPQHRDFLLETAAYAAATNFGPYASGWLHDAGLVVFNPAKLRPEVCRGSFDRTDSVGDGFESHGWAYSIKNPEDKLLVVLVGPANETIGYGVTGGLRPDVQAATAAGMTSGWLGFPTASTKPVQAYAYVRGGFCPLAPAH